MLSDLVSFIRLTNNNTELFIIEKLIKKGHISLNLNLNIDENGIIKNDYEIKGLVKDTNINFLDQGKIENINFNFNLRHDVYSLNEIKFNFENINFISENLKIKKNEKIFFLEGTVENNQSIFSKNIYKLLNLNFKNLNIDEVKFLTKNKFSFQVNNKFKIKNIILNSDINITNLKYVKSDLIKNYLPDINKSIIFKNHNLNLNYKNNNLVVKGEGEILLNKETDQIKYLINKNDKDLKIKTELFLKNVNLKKQDFLKNYFPQMNERINLKNHNLKIHYKNKNLSFTGSGKVKIDKSFEQIDYFLEKNSNKINFSTKINIKNTNFKIGSINYKKKKENNIFLKINGEVNSNKNLKINNFMMKEDNNKIKITNLSLSKTNQIIKIDQAEFNYLDTENKKNNFSIKKLTGNDYNINGISLNANSLITNLLKKNDQDENNYFERNLNIKLNIKKVHIDKSYFVKDLKGNLKIGNNKLLDANILASFDARKNISFTVKTNDQGDKITTLFSSKASPLVSRYSFIKGFKDGNEGYLDFYSLKKNGISNSKLIVDNFKVREIPALAKLLALASLQGIADLLTGEGIRFTDLEMNFTTEKKLMRIQELYAIGPAISILLEGYIEADSLISLRGTLVPATTINRSIASLPLIGDLLIGKKAGEGVFGVSFKIKGPPQKLETTVNPIKTLTPRFITRTLEKIKKN